MTKDFRDLPEGAIDEPTNLVKVATEPDPNTNTRNNRQAGLHSRIAKIAVPLDLLEFEAQVPKGSRRDLSNTFVSVTDPYERLPMLLLCAHPELDPLVERQLIVRKQETGRSKYS